MYDSAIHRRQSQISLDPSDENLLVRSLRTTCMQAVDALHKLPIVSTSALGSGESNDMTGSGVSTGGDVRMTVEDTANAYTGVILLLQTIGTMMVESRCSHQLKGELVQSGCLKACLGKLLFGVQYLLCRRAKESGLN